MPIFGYDSSSNARAPLAVLVEREAVPFGLVRRDGQRPRKRPRRIERFHLGAECRRPRRPDAADRDALAGEPLIGIVGAQASADIRRAR